ncbi:ribosome biogenesis protein Nop16 [Obelidium mucronatum]|nr:ribosome biogenesis protein Nop16 [Obelidium mucronatum]
MVNPLQRAKRKNSAKRIVSRKTKKMGIDRGKAVSFARGAHPIIMKNWDKNLTLRQNYQRMGLLANLNGKAGGEAVTLRDTDNLEEEEPELTISYRSMEEFEKMPAVSRAGDNEEAAAVEEDDEEFDLDGPITFDEKATVIGSRLGLRGEAPSNDAALKSTRKKIERLPGVMEALEHEVSLGEAPRVYHSSESEADVLTRLAKKYKDDYEAMGRDSKINTYQLTAGQLKRKFKKLNASKK